MILLRRSLLDSPHDGLPEFIVITMRCQFLVPKASLQSLAPGMLYLRCSFWGPSCSHSLHSCVEAASNLSRT
eukprot:7728437-Pyramimonas_sp.AAC.1